MCDVRQSCKKTEFFSNEPPEQRPGQMGGKRRQPLSDASRSALCSAPIASARLRGDECQILEGLMDGWEKKKQRT